jgi:hypothetical protein
MTRIVGADGLSLQDVEEEVLAGARFVVFSTCVSMILVTQRRAGDVHFVRADDPFPKAGLRAMGLTLLLGWWGIPWGPFHTVGALATNLKGGPEPRHAARPGAAARGARQPACGGAPRGRAERQPLGEEGTSRPPGWCAPSNAWT